MIPKPQTPNPKSRIPLIIWLLVFIVIYHSVVSVSAETISFKEILQKAIDNSYDLKIAKVNIQLSKYAVKEVTSLYYPALNARFNTEYLKDLTGGVSGIAAIGNTILTDNTRFQNSFSINLTYNLLGTQRRRHHLAKKDIEENKLIYEKNLKELKLEILELYTQALLTYKELKVKKEILPLAEELCQLKERLFKAGTINKIEVLDEAIRLSKIMEEIERLKANLELLLEDITFYTGQHYDIGVQILDFGTEGTSWFEVRDSDCGKDKEEIIPELQTPSPEIRIYEIEIEKKKVELGILRKKRFPQLGLYSNYTFYGSNRDEPEEAFKDLEQRNWTVGVSCSIPLFQGFKTIVSSKRLKLELERLELERDKKIAEIKSLYTKTKKAIQVYDQEIKTKKGLLNHTQEKTTLTERLYSQQITDKVVLLNQKIELITQQLELEKVEVSKIASIKKLNILRGSGFGVRSSGGKD